MEGNCRRTSSLVYLWLIHADVTSWRNNVSSSRYPRILFQSMRVAGTRAIDITNASLGDSRVSNPRSFTSEDNWMRCVGSYSKLASIQECTHMIMSPLNSIAINRNLSVEKVSIVPRLIRTIRLILARGRQFLQVDSRRIHTMRR